MANTKKTRTKQAAPEKAPVINPMSARRLALTVRLHELARDPDKVAEFEAARTEFLALPPNE